jgi:uncharacterized protein with HEPN domain
MPARPWRQRVLDIIDAVERIRSLTAEVDLEEFRSNPMLHDAVLYSFVVIGEAATHVPPEVQARHPGVPWREIRRMRNFVAHVYHAVSDEIVWDTITGDLPPLIPGLKRVLADEPAGAAADE